MEEETWQSLVRILTTPKIIRTPCQIQSKANTFKKYVYKNNEGTVPSNLVIDHVEAEDTDGILCFLMTRQSGVPGVEACGHLGEHLTHGVGCGVEGSLLYWQPGIRIEYSLAMILTLPVVFKDVEAIIKVLVMKKYMSEKDLKKETRTCQLFSKFTYHDDCDDNIEKFTKEEVECIFVEFVVDMLNKEMK